MSQTRSGFAPRHFVLGTLVLALLAGGAWVVTLRIADPVLGPPATTYLPHLRPGVHAISHTVNVVGLGDSVTSGYNCACESYVGMYASLLANATRMTVKARNFGVPGATSGDLAGTTVTDLSTREALRKADVVLITIGANDFDYSTYAGASCDDLSCYAGDLETLKENLTQIATSIASLRGSRRTLVLSTGYWAVWLDGAIGRAQGSQYLRIDLALTRKVNQITAEVSRATRTRYVDVYTPFHGAQGTRDDTNLLSDDGDHPNAAGHSVIAAALIAEGVPRED